MREEHNLKMVIIARPVLNPESYTEEKFLAVKVTGMGKQYGAWIKETDVEELWLSRVSDSLNAVVADVAKAAYVSFHRKESA